jgi:hypothetical protein
MRQESADIALFTDSLLGIIILGRRDLWEGMWVAIVYMTPNFILA